MSLANERFDVLRKNDGTFHILPTDIAQFQRLDGCMRFLRWRLCEQNNGAASLQHIMRRAGVTIQRPAPLPLWMGMTFEQSLVRRLGQAATDYSEIDTIHNAEVLRVARSLPVGEVVYLLQPNIMAVFGQWTVRGRPDMLRMVRSDDQTLLVYIIDIKSSFAVKNEHQLQVAMYQLLLQHILAPLADTVQFQTGIIHRIPHDVPSDRFARERLQQAQQAAQRILGWHDVCLDETPHPEQFCNEVAQLFAFGYDSQLVHVVQLPFAQLPFAYTAQCEECPFMELCLQRSVDTQDIALVPHMDRQSRSAFANQQVTTVAQLAQLKEVGPDRRITDQSPTPTLLHRLARSEVIGAMLDQWVVRAQRALTSMGQQLTVGYPRDFTLATLPKIPATGDCAVLYIDAHRDHFNGALWHVGVLIEHFRDGVSTRTYPIVLMSDTTPTFDHERQLLLGLIAQIHEVWQHHLPHALPVHIVVYESTTLDMLRQALARIAPQSPSAAAWHDVLTDPQTYRQFRVTVLTHDIQAMNLNPYVLSSLMAVASQAQVRWADAHHNFREIFRTRHFDSMGKHANQQLFYIKRARFRSSMPLEYAYAAWQQLPAPHADGDQFAPYRMATLPIIATFLEHRLQAIRTVAARHGRWFAQIPDALELPQLAQTTTPVVTLGDVLAEYMTIERNAQVQAWIATHALAPANRVRALTSLMLEYRDADQPSPVRTRIELERKRLAAHPNQLVTGLQGITIRLRVVLDDALPDIDTLFGSVPLASESHDAVLSIVADDTGKAASPRQLLHDSMRVKVVQREQTSPFSWVELEIQSGRVYQPYQFGSRMFLPADGGQYMLDESPDHVPGSIQHQAMSRLLQVPHSNKLYRMLTGDVGGGLGLAPAALHDYVQAWSTCDGPVFTGDALRYVTSFADAALLMVQGPPGTGKTFTTAHAIMARMYAAMQAGRPLRVVVSCQTHAAIRAALQNVSSVLHHIRSAAHPHAKQLQRIKLYRYRPTEGEVPITGVDIVRDKGVMSAHITAQDWCVVGATPTGIAALAQDQQQWCDLVILDEASQMSLPLALMATQPLQADGALVIVGDPRQMPAIVSHEWDSEPRLRYQQMPVYLALFDYLLWLRDTHDVPIPMAKLADSYRVPPRLADFLRSEIYAHDGIDYRGVRQRTMQSIPHLQGFVRAALSPEYSLILVRHNESASKSLNQLEARLVTDMVLPLLKAGYDAQTGFGVVVPHRMQRSAIRAMLRPHVTSTSMFGVVNDVPGVDTVERYQGSERQVMIVSATESDVEYIRRNEGFLFDRRRLNVALSRAQVKIIVVVSQQVLTYIARDQELAQHSQMWKNFQNQWCTESLWHGTVAGVDVEVLGG